MVEVMEKVEQEFCVVVSVCLEKETELPPFHLSGILLPIAKMDVVYFYSRSKTAFYLGVGGGGRLVVRKP
jgi:hypothetical protein